MASIHFKRMWFAALSAISLSSVLSCFYQTYDGPIDIEEQQSVWQYLNVYSIYQERLPDECGDYAPLQLFDKIGDTLKGGRYTEYRYLNKNAAGAAAALSASRITGDTILAITPSTAYIRISTFSDTALLRRFNNWRSNLMNFKNIVIDLRHNTGGYLYLTDSIVGEFIPAGAKYISTRHRVYDEKKLKGKTVEWEGSKNAKKNPVLTGKKIAVLIDSLSASASEIVASALKDCANAYLIGDTSYGKGIGQVIIPRAGRDSLSITFMEIRGLSNRTGNYHKIGIAPDVACPTDSCLDYAVKQLEPGAGGRKIRAAEAEVARAMSKKRTVEPAGLYVVTEPDPLK